jgi:PKD repeat protein
MTFVASTASNDASATYSWNFGDGTHGSGPTIHHVFPAPSAAYNVTLTVANSAGSTTATTVVTARSMSGTWMNLINPKAYIFTFSQEGTNLKGQGIGGQLTDARNITFWTTPAHDYVFTGVVEKDLDSMEVSYPSPDGLVSLRLVRCYTPQQSCL